MVSLLHSSVMWTVFVLFTITLFTYVLRKIFRTKRLIKRRAESPRTMQRQAMVTRLSLFAIFLAFISELSMFSLIATLR